MITLKNIVKTYNKGKTNAYKALHGVSLEIKDGEMVAIMGTSGAGKSTLLHIMGCIDSYDSGVYQINERLIDKLSEKKLSHIRNEEIGIVMQDFALVESFTGLENVMIPLDFAKKKQKAKVRKEKATKALEDVGMLEFAKKPVSKLSGGQKQRIAIARAIVNEPSLILADEPTGALDSKISEEIMDVLEELNEKGRTIIIVTHDKKVADRCHRMVEISDGRLREVIYS